MKELVRVSEARTVDRL